jgi:serine/threonine-protein kinase RsbW
MGEEERAMRGRISLELPSDPWTVSLCRRVLRSFLKDLAIEETRLDDIELAVSEATGNVVRHAYPRPDHPYRVILTFWGDRVCLEVSDQGIGFNRADVPEPGTEELGGRGLWLIEQIADVTAVSTLPGGGCRLEAEFHFPHPIPLSPPAVPYDAQAWPIAGTAGGMAG